MTDLSQGRVDAQDEKVNNIEVSDGKINLLIYTENDNTYIECYENGKIFRTYIIESDVTEKIKKIINIGGN